MDGLQIKALERRIGQRRGATRAPTRAPEWPGRLQPPRIKSDPPVHNLLGPKNGLDNGGHLRVFHALARQKEWQILEGHLMPDHVPMSIAIPPKHPVASVMGSLKGKSAIAIARLRARSETSRASTSGPAVTTYPPLGSNWNRSANTCATKRSRMEQAENSDLTDEARNARRLL
jgi:REP element-mobilizing transposase RayT